MGRVILVGLCMVGCVVFSLLFVVVGWGLAVDLVRNPPVLMQREVVYVLVPVSGSMSVPISAPTPAPVVQIEYAPLQPAQFIAPPALSVAPTPMVCDLSYPDFCLPPSLSDTLNCKEIPFHDFRVLPPDPHQFDGDQDGVGCES